MGFTIEAGVSAMTVFLQGLVSFFSPCVLPLVPLYIGYLAGGTQTVDADGTVRFGRKKVLINTLFFVLGVSFAFFLLGFGFTALGRFFSGNRLLFARIGGAIVIVFGLFQLGLFGGREIGREHRLPLHLEKLTMNPVTALVMGFTFSFAWTPCVGPALASVLLMASSSNSAAAGFGLIGVYTLGFVLPFLGVGLFTSSLLDLFKRHRNVVRYTVKVGGVLMVLMGVMMITGWMNGVTGYLSGLTGGGAPAPAKSPAPEVTSPTEVPSPTEDPSPTAAPSAEETPSPTQAPAVLPPSPTVTPSDEPEKIPAPDFTLTDQNGKVHTLSDYKGQVVFLNFWATWCGPCRQEMPEIQALYEKHGLNEGDVVVLGVANPKTEEVPYNSDKTIPEVTQFLADGGYTYPTVMDVTGDVLAQYGISAFPTTFMIDRDGNVFGYVTGTLTADIMDDIVEQTLSGVRR